MSNEAFILILELSQMKEKLDVNQFNSQQFRSSAENQYIPTCVRNPSRQLLIKYAALVAVYL